MAASLSRPDPSSPASVAEAGFSTSRRGFTQDEVRAFLTSVAAELGRLQERERQLDAQLRAAQTEVPLAPELDEETVAALLGEETLRVLQTARESASQIKIRAEENAAKVLHDANDEANRLRQEAEVEAARKRHDASSDAEAEVALAKQQGREMVNEARAYRERVLADLERRTKVARQQIEDLVNGRDRLLQVFERARLVAVDVTSELQSIDGPAEFVNLSPTTGPLPLMVPASEMGAAAPSLDDEMRDATDDMSTLADAAGADEIVDHLGSDADDDTEAVATEPARLARDANVVSLFRGRIEPADGQDGAGDDGDDVDTVAGSEIDATDPEFRPDVGDIFERLRSEAPGEAADEADESDPDTDLESDPEHLGGADEVAVESDADLAVAESTPFTRRDEALVPLVVAGSRKLKRLLADEQNGVLDLLRQKDPVTQLDELISDVDAHADGYIGALAEELLEAAVAGAAEVGKNDTKTLRTTITKGGALDRSHAVVRDDLVAPLRARLDRAIADGGGDNEDVTKRVRAVYREWKTQHIDDQLDDAFRFAHGGGLAAGVKPGTAMSWVIDPSEPTCPDCEDNSLAGDVASGDAYPTGHVSAPAHPGCRCLTVPAGQ